MKCSTKTEALKISGLKTGKPRIKKSGKALNGKSQKPSSSRKIPIVTGAEFNLSFPIIQTWKYMESQNILTYQVLWPSVTYVMAEHTQENFSVLFAINSARNPKVKDAILALTIAINEVLETTKQNKTRNGTRSRGRKAGSTDQLKLSASRPANG